MKNTVKKAVLFIGVISILFGLSPIATYYGYDFPGLSFWLTEVEAATSGTCGDDLTWSLNMSTGELEINGTGEMKNYSSNSATPWYSYETYIGKVIINNGPTTIGNNAFSDCDNLISISISDSVSKIGHYAFDGCENLTQIKLPQNVTSIGYYSFGFCRNLKEVCLNDGLLSIGYGAFYCCGNLAQITIPNSVKSIGEYAFYNCDNLSSVKIGTNVNTIDDAAFLECDKLINITIPSSVTNIGISAFRSCKSLQKIIVDENNPNYYTDGDGVLFNKDITTLLQYPSGKKEKSYIIPDGIESIGIHAFSENVELTNVTFNNTVKNIGDYSFCGCAELSQIELTESVKNIGNGAFESCEKLSCVSFSGSLEDWKAISIKKENTNLYNSIVLESKSEKPYYYADTYVCGENLSWVLYTNGELVINGTGNMQDYPYYSVAPWQRNRSNIKVITFSDEITSIGDNAFYGCTGLEKVIIPEKVTSIGDNAFYGCTDLENIIIPETTSNIGSNILENCPNLSGVYYSGTLQQWNCVTVGNNNNRLKELLVIDYCSERPCFYPDTCGENLTWTLYTDGELVIDGTGAMTDYSAGSYVPWYSKRSKIKSATISNGVTSIGDYAFQCCDELTSVTLGNSLTSIGDCAFYKCPTLTKITIPDSITSIGSSAFYGCIGLTSITIPDSVTSIGDYAFYGCAGLTGITIGKSVMSIGFRAFRDCTGLTSVTIPDSVTNIGDEAFYRCNNIENAVLGKGVASIGVRAFCLCESLEKITIKSDLKSIGDYSFVFCSKLKTITLPNSVLSIGIGVFNSSSNLSSVYYTGTIEEWNLISLGKENDLLVDKLVFDCNSEKPYLMIGSCGKSLDWILYADGSLFINGVGEMDDYLSDFYTPWGTKSNRIKSITVSIGVLNIGKSAFRECYNLKEVVISDSVKRIGKYAFSNCSNLVNIKIGNEVESIDEDAFYNCSRLNSIIIPINVQSIENNAFSNCSNLEKIEICNNSIQFEQSVFDGSTNVKLYCNNGSSAQSYANKEKLTYVITDNNQSELTIKNNMLASYCGDSPTTNLLPFITSIGSCAFQDNSVIKSVYLPNSVSSINNCAFLNCSSLERVVIPHTVSTIAPDAFNGTNATIVCYADSYAHQYAVEQGISFELISVTLNQTKVFLSVGEYAIITATPEQKFLDSVQTSWKSSDTRVATVDTSGKVTAKCSGTTTIYALAPTGEILATCSVQVGYSFSVTIQNPSTKTINYKSGIVLHATVDNLPAGAKIVWEKNNDAFSMSDNGNGNCTIVSKSNGSTTFTAKVELDDGSIAKDPNGNEISAQVTMNSKASFFDKVVAFFKGLFGGNKVLPQLFKGIY